MSKNSFGSLPHKDLISVADLGRGDIDALYDAARALKKNRETMTDLHDAAVRHRP